MTVNQEKLKFEMYLARAGLKMTTGRRMVFEEAMQAHGHFSPEDLMRQCKSHRRKVSRATVYRCLKELLESGIIRATAYGEKHQHYEHIYDEKPHHHARCIHCGDMLEFPCLKEEDQYAQILRENHFEILGHEMHFYGACARCRR